MKKILLLLLLALAIFLTGCGRDELYQDPAFVGTWHWEGNVQWTYVFNEDGTGQRGDAQIQSFRWGTRNNTLIIDTSSHGRLFRETHDYTFEEDNLITLDDGGMMAYTYLRSTENQDLLGSWVNLQHLQEINFNEYTIGVTVPFDSEPDEHIDFNWFASDNILIQQFGPLDQWHWTYTINGDFLLLESTQVTGYRLEYVRGEFSNNPELLGAWAWEEDPDWEYYFLDDATCFLGFSDSEGIAIWTTFNNYLFILDPTTFTFEQWEFFIDGDTLILNSVGVHGRTFRYNRTLRTNEA
ncbi:MAG: hypothetical protein FWD82_08085 [Defluviitaleaceae bacterium]|nr:hypothetical protein [Defluviitaleaceae bacterium]